MNIYLTRAIICELSYAVTVAIDNDVDLAKSRTNRAAYSSYYKDWGVQVSTDLTAVERTNLAAAGSWIATPILTLAGGLGGSAEATNEQKWNFFKRLSDLYKPQMFPNRQDNRAACRDPNGRQEGSPLVDIDFHLIPTLESRVQTVSLGLVDRPGNEEKIFGEKNILSQTVSIRETISGSFNPSWTFTNGSVNSGGTLFSSGRDRTHQVVITFGQLASNKQSLTPLAEVFHNTQVLKSGLQAYPFFR